MKEKIKNCDNIQNIEIFSLDDMKALGASIAEELKAGLLIGFDGELGAGKSTLIYFIGAALGVNNMASPSFVLAKEYENCTPPLLHVDLYRLSDAAAYDFLCHDLLEYAGTHVLLIEWFGRIKNKKLPQEFENSWSISIEADFNQSRMVSITKKATLRSRQAARPW